MFGSLPALGSIQSQNAFRQQSICTRVPSETASLRCFWIGCFGQHSSVIAVFFIHTTECALSPLTKCSVKEENVHLTFALSQLSRHLAHLCLKYKEEKNHAAIFPLIPLSVFSNYVLDNSYTMY